MSNTNIEKLNKKMRIVTEKLESEGLNVSSRTKLQKELKELEKEERKLLGLPNNNNNANNNNANNNNVNNINKIFSKLKLNNTKKIKESLKRANKKGPKAKPSVKVNKKGVKAKSVKRNVPKTSIITRGERRFLQRVMNEETTNLSEKYRKERNAEINRRAKTKKNNNNNNNNK